MKTDEASPFLNPPSVKNYHNWNLGKHVVAEWIHDILANKAVMADGTTNPLDTKYIFSIAVLPSPKKGEVRLQVEYLP